MEIESPLKKLKRLNPKNDALRALVPFNTHSLIVLVVIH